MGEREQKKSIAIIDRNIAKDTMTICHPVTLEILAQRKRGKEGRFQWRSSNPNIQRICDLYSEGSTAGGLAIEIMKFLNI